MFSVEQLARCPDAFGELLRSQFFSDNGFGCYENFELREGIRDEGKDTLSVQNFDGEDDLEEWTFAEWDSPIGTILMEYHWDGDGTLIFSTEDWSLSNDDCKKTNCWEFNVYPSNKEIVNV